MEPASPVSTAPRKRRLRLSLFLAIIGVGAFYAWDSWRNRVPDRAPPEVGLAGVDPEVVQAVTTARDAVHRTPRSAAAWGELGEVLHAHLFNSDAMECYAHAERLDPREPRWPFHQGMILFPDRPEEALPKLQRAAELAPEKPDIVVCRLGELLLATDRVNEARERFESLLRLDSTHPVARLGLARIALMASNYDECTRHAEVCLSSPHAKKAVHTLLAELRQRQGDTANAAKEQERAAELPPDRPWPDPFTQTVSQRKVGEKARIRHATQLMDQGQHVEAANDLRRLVGDYPNSAQGWQMLGYSLLMARDAVGAEKALLRSIELDVTQPRPHFYLGIVLHGRGDRTGAAAKFRAALAAKPDYAAAYFNLGVTLKEDGKRAAAIQAFRDAIRCQPSQAASHAQLGELLLQEGRTEEARTHLENAVQLNPRDRRSAEMLAGSKK